MINSKTANLKPLLESKNGIHLTAYLVNRGDLSDLKLQLSTIIDEACDWLSSAMTPEEQKKFLEPIHSLLNDARILSQMKGNIGLFRNEESFRVLNIPIDVEQSCQVATSFHIKPLLRWLQGDQEFLFLGLEAEAAHLYFGSQSSFKLIDSFQFPNFFKTKRSQVSPVVHETSSLKGSEKLDAFTLLNERISNLTKTSQPRLFLAGAPGLIREAGKTLQYKKIVKIPVAKSFDISCSMELCKVIRAILKEDSQKSLEKALLEFRFAEESNRVKKNIFQISKAVVQGKVRKLIVTDELSIFGKIDLKSGDLAIHPFDLDHEDDCILDDLAQMVLSQGGEVVIANRDEIPKGRPILAILDYEEDALKKIEALEYRDIHESYR